MASASTTSVPANPQTRIWFMLYAQVMQADGASYRNVLVDHRLGFTLRDPEWQVVRNPQHASSREPRTGIVFAQEQIDERLAPIHLVDPDHPSEAIFDAVRDGMPNVEQREDPLGRELGRRRILRTSPLPAEAFVGWVERSETHHRAASPTDGFRSRSTHPTSARLAPRRMSGAQLNRAGAPPPAA
jgi:hypothetical protein